MARHSRSRWHDPDRQEYWNLRLKEEGLGVVRGRQVIKKGKPPRPGKKARRVKGGRRPA